MLGFKRITIRSSFFASQISRLKDNNRELFYEIPLSQHCLAQRISNRFLDIYQFGNKNAIEKERARLAFVKSNFGPSADEMNRGYFADFNELKQHGGKIAMANKIIIPALAAVKFPNIEVNFSDGKALKLPIDSTVNENAADTDKSRVPKVSLMCLQFRANSKPMIDSWSLPFFNAFQDSKDVHLYQISFIDSWLLCRTPIKRLLVWIMKKSEDDGKSDTLKKQIVYSFGDHYYFRKELHILNLLTGYIFLLDKFGRIRWQGSGLATQEELGSLLSCTSLLLEEN